MGSKEELCDIDSRDRIGDKESVDANASARWLMQLLYGGEWHSTKEPAIASELRIAYADLLARVRDGTRPR